MRHSRNSEVLDKVAAKAANHCREAKARRAPPLHVSNSTVARGLLDRPFQHDLGISLFTNLHRDNVLLQ